MSFTQDGPEAMPEDIQEDGGAAPEAAAGEP